MKRPHDLLDGPAIAALLFCVYVAGLAPTVHWLDTGALTGSAWTMGVAHPPGEPAWLALAKLAQLIPVGDIAFRTSLLSAACMAACALPLMWAVGPEARADRTSSTGFVVLAALTALAPMLQGVRPEVYGLTALLLLLALAAALRLGGLAGSAAVGLLLGLGAAVHPLLCAVAAPALVLARRTSSVAGLRDAGAVVVGGIWGFAAYAWLPLRALAVPGRAWGVPDSPARFVDVLLARTFARNFGGEAGGGLLDNLLVVLGAWTRAGLPAFLLLGLLACVAWRGREAQPGAKPLLAVTLLWLAGNAATILPQNKVFATNPDLLGYLAIGALGAVPLAVVGLGTLGHRRRLLIALLLFGLLLIDGLESGKRRGDHGAATFAVHQAAALPPGAILVPSGNDTAFVWTYLQGVERRRADLVLMPRVLMGHRHELERLGGRGRLAELGVPWSPELRDDPAWALKDATRPVFIELREPERRRVDRGELRRHGLVAVNGRAPPEGPWLESLRTFALSELEGDPEAELVRLYFEELWRDAP